MGGDTGSKAAPIRLIGRSGLLGRRQGNATAAPSPARMGVERDLRPRCHPRTVGVPRPRASGRACSTRRRPGAAATLAAAERPRRRPCLPVVLARSPLRGTGASPGNQNPSGYPLAPDARWGPTNSGSDSGSGGEGPPVPWVATGPSQPWDGGGHWNPGQWGGPPIWIAPRQAPRNRPLHVLAVAALVTLVALLGVAVGRTTDPEPTRIELTVHRLAAVGAHRRPAPSSRRWTPASSTSPPGSASKGARRRAPAWCSTPRATCSPTTTSSTARRASASLTSATARPTTAPCVGTDKTQDIAVVKMQGASGLRTVAMGNSSTWRSAPL